MATLQEKMIGAFGSDIYAAGTYSVAAGTLLNPIYAVEHIGTDVTLTAVTGNGGERIEGKWIQGTGTAITADTGLMTFSEDVHAFTCSAAVKVWYARK